MDLRESLNKIDHYCIDNNRKFYDLRSLYESVEPKLTPQEKMELSKIVRDTNDPKVISASLNQMVSESLNEYLTDDELIDAIQNGKPFDLDDYKRFAHTDGPAYEELDHKMVLDSDGFQTDYTLYYDNDLGEYICIFGDKDLYNPDNADFDAEFETEEEAREWFDSYNGFEDDLMDESVNKEKIINEKFYLRTGKEDDAFKWLASKMNADTLLSQMSVLYKSGKSYHNMIEDIMNANNLTNKEFGTNILTKDEVRAQWGEDAYNQLYGSTVKESLIFPDGTVFTKPIEYRNYKIKQNKSSDEFLTVFDEFGEVESDGFTSIDDAKKYIDDLIESQMYDDWQMGKVSKFNKYPDDIFDEPLPFESLDKSLLKEDNGSFEYKGFIIVDGDPVYVYKDGKCIGSYSTDTDATQQIDLMTESYADTLGGVGTAAGTALGLLEPTPFGEVAGATVGGQVGKAVGGILDAIHQHRVNKAARNNNMMTEELTDIEKQCKEKFEELTHILLDDVQKDDNCDDAMVLQRVNNAFKAVGGKSGASQDSPTYVRFNGYVPVEAEGFNGKYTVGGSISGKGYIRGDLNRLAEDLTMAYNVKLGGDHRYTPGFIKKLMNESLDEDSYSENEITSILKKLTNDFSKEGSVKTFYKEEKELAKNILKKYYKYVDVSDGRHDSDEEMNWVISFSGVK